MPYPDPPNKQDLFWFLFGGFFSMLAELMRSLHGGEPAKKGWLVTIFEAISVAFWGGLAGWLLAYYTQMDAPLLAAVAALSGHYGHRGAAGVVIAIVRSFGVDLRGDNGKGERRS